jgi:hypothetical protein
MDWNLDTEIWSGFMVNLEAPAKTHSADGEDLLKGCAESCRWRLELGNVAAD